MTKRPPIPAKPPVSRRPARSVWSSHSDVRSVQIGVVVTILIHVLLLALAPKIERFLDSRDAAGPADEWGAREFQIELTPEQPQQSEPPAPLPMPQFVEINPDAPDNAPDKTENVGAQNQQVAQETPTPPGKTDAPASKGDPASASTAIVSGQQTEPQPPARRPPPPTNEPETPEQQAARRAQIPLAGTEKFEGESPDGFGANVGKPAPDAKPVPDRVDGAADSKSDTGPRVGLYYKRVDPSKPQPRPTLAPNVVKARPSPLAHREFGTENIGAVAYNAKWSAYGEYLQKFIESVDIQWQRIVEQSTTYPVAGTKVVVTFRMNSKGSISEIIKVESEGGRAAKDGCVSAIVARDPYGEWPDDMVGVLGESQEITFTFLYN